MPIDTGALAAAIGSGDRTALARAITLVESTRADHRAAARELSHRLKPPREICWRVGISGVPGSGKSTLIETLGSLLTSRGHRVGVLAIDPSSVRTGGSVLGDKTRMPRLAADVAAFIRPSPTAGTLGGVARATAQTVPLLEAAGYDVILVETVGVGQSETAASSMVDTFLLLGLARSGDQLQGIKRGVLEIADVVAINKADGDATASSRSAASELAGALRLMRGASDDWAVPVVTCSGLTGDGVDEVWTLVGKHRESLGIKGISAKRSTQQWALTQHLVADALLSRLTNSESARGARSRLQPQVLAGSVSAVAAADEILAAFDA
ncbi:MAG: methylmalonyl Co-A mutase-associated GTPase MeaB [Nakamurella sp.]